MLAAGRLAGRLCSLCIPTIVALLVNHFYFCLNYITSNCNRQRDGLQEATQQALKSSPLMTNDQHILVLPRDECNMLDDNWNDSNIASSILA